MSVIDFIHEPQCPNVSQARQHLREALARAGWPQDWREWEIGDAPLPEHLRGYGSPTILVGGREVTGAAPGGSDDCCRVYRDAQGTLRGVPSVEVIVAALEAAPRPEQGAARSSLAALPGVGIALLPQVACPSCWPAYAGVMSASGLGFLMDDAWLMPVTGLSLIGALAALGWRARRRRGYGPLALGIAATALLVGKFALGSEGAMVAGATLLMAASVWNAWPRRVGRPESPPGAAPITASCCPPGS